MTEETEEPVDLERLQGWDPAVAPARFAERVLDAWAREREAVHQPRSGWSRAGRFGVVGAALAVALVSWWSWPRGEATAGTLVAQGRQTLSLGSRARVVVEPGVDLEWQVARDGAAHVEQHKGAAFYRVDGGSPFEVVTPYGMITVEGTCFSVEVVEDMEHSKSWGKGMALGATLAAAVVVTVYEGQVVLADGGDTVEVGPGERGVADGGGRPSRIGAAGEESVSRGEPDTSTLAKNNLRTQAQELERLRATEIEQRREIARLSQEIEALGGSAAEADPAAGSERCVRAMRGEDGCSFVDPDQETLLEMARCGTVKVDQPGFLEQDGPIDGGGRSHEVLGLSPDEATVLVETAEQFREQYVRRLRQFYVEAGGEAAVVEDLPPRAIESLLRTMLDRNELEAAHRLVSKERAGLVEPPSEGSSMPLAERYARHMLDVGNHFEAAVGEALGPERAHDLRRAEDGWPGGTSVFSSGACED